MVSDEANHHLVRWNSEDQDSGFMIIDPNEFELQILPQYFKLSNLDSFIRQLNMYDFHKKNRRQRDCKVFYHPYFNKNSKEMLVNIKRKSPPYNKKIPISNIIPEKLEKEYVQSTFSNMTTEQSTCHESGSVGIKRRASTDVSCLEMTQNSAESQKI